MPFSRSAQLYDVIYSPLRDYELQAKRVGEWIKEKKANAQTVLDIACGTGLHLSFLKSSFDVAGLDVSKEMVGIAQSRNPDVPFFVSDMRNFDLGRRYDAVICLFSTITYAKTITELESTIENFAKHLVPQGICIVEPYIPPELWQDEEKARNRTIETSDINIAMVDSAERVGRHVRREIRYKVRMGDNSEEITEIHEFRLYSRNEYVAAFLGAGFEVEFDEIGFVKGRGMYIATLQQ